MSSDRGLFSLFPLVYEAKGYLHATDHVIKFNPGGNRYGDGKSHLALSWFSVLPVY